VEEYVYHIYEPGKRMLYRFWEAPLYLPNQRIHVDEPHITLLDVKCPDKSVAYAKDFRGEVHILSNYTPKSSEELRYLVYKIGSLAYTNEVGCYFPDGIPLGDYSVRYVFELTPPIRGEGVYAHLNIMLAREHIFYRSFEVSLVGFDLVKLYTHPPETQVTRVGGNVLIKGSSPSNMILEIEFITTTKSLEGRISYIENIPGIITAVDNANKIYYESYYFLKNSFYASIIALVIFPIALAVEYQYVGREKNYVVPKYLSYVPNKNRKPWEVNLLFAGDAFTIDENAFYATLMDFYRRGFIDLYEVGDDLVIKIRDINTGELDNYYEWRVYEFLSKYSNENNEFSLREFSEKIKNEVRRGLIKPFEVINELNKVFGTSDELRDYAMNFFVPRKPIPILLGIIIIIIGIVFLATVAGYSDALYNPLYKWGSILAVSVVLIEVVISYKIPSQVYGNWRNDYYKERLEWDAFGNMLRDLALISKYAPQDIVIWKEWLIYGTALGLAEHVIKALEKLRVPTPNEALVYIKARPVMTQVRTYVYGTAAGKTAGLIKGVGAGGGFGGGGGGVR
jgi:uncharacterized membrane protein